MLALVGKNPHYSVQAQSKGGLRTAGIYWRRPDAFRHALETLLDELDSGATARARHRPTRQGAGKKGRRNR